MGKIVNICNTLPLVFYHKWQVLHQQKAIGATYGFIHFAKRNRLGSQKAKDLVFVDSNLCLVSHRGEEYTSGPHKGM